MAYETLIVDNDGHIAVIKLNRPEALNAINGQLLEELAAALQEAQANKKIRSIIITGSEKAFAAGADIKAMSEMSYAEVFGEDLFTKDLQTITSIRKPIIAAVAGYALGGGCELAMMCDMIIAADTAKFGQPELNLGVPPGMGGTQRLARAIGKAKAMDMILTGRTMDAEEAERAGLVARVVPSKSLMSEALAIAEKIAEKSMPSVMAAKELVNKAYETTLNEGISAERRLFHAMFATEDQKEGMHAFLEKREARFRDK